MATFLTTLNSRITSILLGLALTYATTTHAQILNSPAWKDANQALQEHLWEIATPRFEALLPQAKTPQEIEQISEKILESTLHNNNPSLTLSKLDQAPFTSLPSAWFWRAQALIQLGQYQHAIDALSPALNNSKSPHTPQALLSRAALEQALQLTDQALNTLKILEKIPNSQTIAQLRQSQIFLEKNNLTNAESTLPDPKKIPKNLLTEFKIHRANLYLAQNKGNEASLLYVDILTQTHSFNTQQYFQANLGLIDTNLTLNNKEDAITQIFQVFNVLNNLTEPQYQLLTSRLLSATPDKLNPDNPIFERLKSLLPSSRNTPTPTPLLAFTPDSLTSLFPQPTTTNDDSPTRTPAILWTLAQLRERVDLPDAQTDARSTYQKIRLLYPNSTFAPKALLATAKLDEKFGQTERSTSILQNLINTLGQNATYTRGLAAFTLAEILANHQQWHNATQQFELAASLLQNHEKQIAQFNAAISQIQQTQQTQNQITPNNPNSTLPTQSQLGLNLELEQIILEKNPTSSLALLQQFILQHPQHPRISEAYFAAISAALRCQPPATQQAQQLLNEAQKIPNQPADQIAWTNIQISLTDPTQTTTRITQLQTFLSQFPQSTLTHNATWLLGQEYFRNRNYNNARLILEKFALEHPKSTLANQALLLSARAAALGATEQSRNEAIGIFQKIIEKNDPNLAPIARLELARLQIDISQLNPAISQLSTWFAGLDPQNPLRLPAGILLSEALYAQHTPESLQSALNIYQQLLQQTPPNSSDFNRLSYLRGLTLEQTNQTAAALDSYYSVLLQNQKQKPTEWEWLERCGFRALKLLEEAKRWQAAISIAEQISHLQGPRAQEATERAKKLRLEHMIWAE